ncbi:MAG: T9SS type A sorting domain-containing protein [Ignavibacteriaceae bacterium]|nr:T9SS type A sorting domain-containing protein [Ignavibacteriaceae bacterium]
MKNIMFISFVVLLTNICSAQQNTFNKEEELKKFVEQGGKVEESSPGIYKLTYPDGLSRVYDLNRSENIIENLEGVDTTIINIWEIDTTKFNSMFKFWQKVQVANFWWAPLPIEDLNNNSRSELYGFTDVVYPNFAGPVQIFEKNLNGIYQNVFSYSPPTAIVKGIADINGIGDKEIFIMSIEDGDSTIFSYPFYKSDSIGYLPTIFDFFFYIIGYQVNDVTFGDWDNNGITDCAFTVASVWIPTMCNIAEYRDSINNFEELFRFSSIKESDLSGFAIDDFDQDDKTEIVISSGPGNVFIIENEAENEYSLVNQFPFPTYNAYMQTATNDIDGNGKSEYWIGGQDYEEGITVFQCYEANGDNNYEPAARIELRYLTSFYNEYIQAVDVNDDGLEELVISIGNIILILKFAGSPDNHRYKLWYAKIGEATQPGAQFYPAAIADLDGDGKKDLLIPMEKYTPSITYAFSYILRMDEPSDVFGSEIRETTFDTIQAYPNPFNSETHIRYSIPESGKVAIIVYDVLGRKVETLVDDFKQNGNYELTFNANELSSGVYFYRITSSKNGKILFTDSKQMILMK